MDIAALEEAGFEKRYATTEWEEAMQELPKLYPDTDLQMPYVLDRDTVRITFEQNTREQAPFGISMTVRYPAVAVVENKATGARAAVAADDTELILRVADDMTVSQ